jgi:hypothetical protein
MFRLILKSLRLDSQIMTCVSLAEWQGQSPGPGVSTFLLPEGGIENSPGRGVPDGLLLPVGGSPGLA